MVGRIDPAHVDRRLAWPLAGRWAFVGARVALGVAVLAFAVVAWIGWTDPAGLLHGPYGGDFGFYVESGRDWLSGRGFYFPFQLEGPYEIGAGPRLYPPIALPLFLVGGAIPGWLWWAIPTAVVAGVVLYWRPKVVGWAGIFACLAVPSTGELYSSGNPVMWIAAAVALSTIWPWVSVFALLKPTLAPFALVGIRSRTWWLAAAGLGILSILLVPLWLDYVTVILNARGSRVGLLYSLGDVPMVLIPVIAWAARSRRTPAQTIDTA